MNILNYWRRSATPVAPGEDLDEWQRHHDDPRSWQGYDLFCRAYMDPDLDEAELREMWQQANALVGQRAPADYGEFLAYGYLEGRLNAARKVDAEGRP